MTRPAVRLVLGLASVAIAGACSGVVQVRHEVDQHLAEDYARMASGVSVEPVEVVGSRQSTYGLERPGGTKAAVDTAVWVVTLSGRFPVGSCLVSFPVFDFPSLGATPTPKPSVKPCPTPSAKERVLVDAKTGEVLDTLPGG
jgi:hypothetical protein